MDPQTTLDLLLIALDEQDRDESVELLSSLSEWLEKGGFFPHVERYPDPAEGGRLYRVPKTFAGGAS